MDYNSLQKASAEPMASSMIETFRAIGYSLETAVADIIDNSVSADAKNIWIERICCSHNDIIGFIYSASKYTPIFIDYLIFI